MSKLICAIALAFVSSSHARASEPETAKVAMAIAEAELTARAAPSMAACFTDLVAAKAIAAKSKKTVVVWVALHCADHPEIRESLSDAIHCHQDTLGGSDDPRLVVLREGQKPVIWSAKELTADRLPEIRKTDSRMDWFF